MARKSSTKSRSWTAPGDVGENDGGGRGAEVSSAEGEAKTSAAAYGLLVKSVCEGFVVLVDDVGAHAAGSPACETDVCEVAERESAGVEAKY